MFRPHSLQTSAASLASPEHKHRCLAGGNKSQKSALSQQPPNSPNNYLMSGGYRAAAKERDEQLLQLNRSAIKACISLYLEHLSPKWFADNLLLMQDLRNANSALANELARTRAACQEVCEQK